MAEESPEDNWPDGDEDYQKEIEFLKHARAPKQPSIDEPKAVENAALLTIVASLCYDGSDPPATHHQDAYDKTIISEEFPYQRNLKITEKWVPVDFGGLESVSVLHISCVKPRLQVTPNEEEKKLNAQKLLEIAGPPDSNGEFLPLLIVHPGESMRVTPAGPSCLYLRARTDTVRIQLLVLPGESDA